VKSFLMQDWVDVSGSAASTVTQSEPFWLDLSGYRDVVAWLDVRESSNSPSVVLQTSPTKDDLFFVTAATLTGAGMPLTTTTILQETASVPLARWVRWQASLAVSAWDISFRLWIAASCPGRRRVNAAGR
jgi:hypothetical protein